MTTYTSPPEPGRTASRRSRPVRLVIGILLALAGFPLLLGGLGLGWAMATQRDDNGFFSTPTEQLTTDTVAFSSEVVNFGEAGPDDWWADRDLATVRLSARSADASAVFVGIAPSADVAGYLGSAYPERLSRGLVLVKSWLLALPHLIVLAVLAGTWQLGDADGFHFAVGGLIGALTLAAGLLLLFTGRYPAPLFDLLVGLNRWVYRVTAYVALMTDTYPPFRLDQGPADPGGVAPTGPDAPATTGLGWPAEA